MGNAQGESGLTAPLLKKYQAWEFVGLSKKVFNHADAAGELEDCKWTDPVTGTVWYRRDALTAWAAGGAA